MPEVQHPTRTGQFQTTVTDLVTLSPRMRRITLSAPQLAASRTGRWAATSQSCWPRAAGRSAGATRSARPPSDHLVVDAVLHGHGPGSSWAQQLQVGDLVRFFGPRGRLELAEADWLLAVTDESGLPAIAALAEAAEPDRPADDGAGRDRRPGRALPAAVRHHRGAVAAPRRPAGRPRRPARRGAGSAGADRPAPATATCSANPGRWSGCATGSASTAWPGTRSMPRATGTSTPDRPAESPADRQPA